MWMRNISHPWIQASGWCSKRCQRRTPVPVLRLNLQVFLQVPIAFCCLYSSISVSHPQMKTSLTYLQKTQLFLLSVSSKKVQTSLVVWQCLCPAGPLAGEWRRCTALWQLTRGRPGVRVMVEGVAIRKFLSIEVGELGFCSGVPGQGSASRNGFAASSCTGVRRGTAAASSVA